MKRYHIWTIGCQMNRADSRQVAEQLEALGYQPTPDARQADVIVLNTCVVRQSAEDRAVGRISALKPLKEKRPGREPIIGVMGCLVGIGDATPLEERFPYVDVFMPPTDGSALINLLKAGEAYDLERQEVARRHRLQDEAAPTLRPSAAGHRQPVSDFVSVIYGCNHVCSFCVIPRRRGNERSRPLDEIVAEVEGLAARGAKEVTLLGQIVDRYGYDLAGVHRPLDHGQAADFQVRPDLADLLRAVHKVDGLARIRFLTSHPNYLTDRLLETVAELPRVCEHIEVPVQAGDDEVLRRMRRRYTVDDYRRLIGRIRQVLPQAGIANDVIVGTPGETEAQFLKTYRLLEELRLDMVHIAAYSPRPGTASARWPDDVPPEEKERRRQALESLQERIVGGINAQLLGQTVEVLVEEKQRGRWKGRTRTNKLVFFEDEADWRGKMARVRITWTGPWSLIGEVVT
ncbi:MAG: tRNA (N6-isopentenyl adenosine(37)-C2)-methylthiotransferase MiaB [Anaerolineae bacterium]|nr:MAG: tRNA (N6-isopentenyl adenosine(37)-C2)-methylthiotransferase MiaB [Anaerolineae bacterium]